MLAIGCGIFVGLFSLRVTPISCRLGVIISTHNVADGDYADLVTLTFFAAKVTILRNPFERSVKCFYNAHRYTHIDC